MPVVHSRRIRSALWIAAAALLVPLALTLRDVLANGGVPAWLRLASLVVVVSTLGFLLSRQRAFERRVAAQSEIERALRESEAKYSGILSIAADAIITVDQMQRIVHFNHGAERIFGYATSDAIGRHVALLIPPRYRTMHERHMEMFARSSESARRMGERREIFGLRADGSEFPAEASISKLVAPDGILFTVVLRDITDRKHAEESERFLAEAGAALARSLDADAVAQTIVDLAVPHLADAALLDLVVDDRLIRVGDTRHRDALSPALSELAHHALTWDSPSPVIDVLRRRRAELVPVIDAEWLEANEETAAIPAWRGLGARAMLVVPITSGGAILGALTLIGIDVERTFSTEDRALATKFATAAASTLQNARSYGAAQQANRAREQVLSVVSHDLRNPISAIAMCARVLDQNPPADDQERRRLIATIRESAAWSDRLIQDLLDVASIEQGRLSLSPHPADPAQLVLQARHMFEVEAAEHGIALAQEIPTNLPLVTADSGRVVQVLGNLMRNAIKFTPDGGRITLGVEPEGERLVFFVRDTGLGIPLEKQARVFDRYWQSSDGARSQGTGLGLSIAKGIIEAHAGEIWVESRPDGEAGAPRGTTVYFSLPAVNGNAN